MKKILVVIALLVSLTGSAHADMRQRRWIGAAFDGTSKPKSVRPSFLRLSRPPVFMRNGFRFLRGRWAAPAAFAGLAAAAFLPQIGCVTSLGFDDVISEPGDLHWSFESAAKIFTGARKISNLKPEEVNAEWKLVGVTGRHVGGNFIRPSGYPAKGSILIMSNSPRSVSMTLDAPYRYTNVERNDSKIEYTRTDSTSHFGGRIEGKMQVVQNRSSLQEVSAEGRMNVSSTRFGDSKFIAYPKLRVKNHHIVTEFRDEYYGGNLFRRGEPKQEVLKNKDEVSDFWIEIEVRLAEDGMLIASVRHIDDENPNNYLYYSFFRKK